MKTNQYVLIGFLCAGFIACNSEDVYVEQMLDDRAEITLNHQSSFEMENELVENLKIELDIYGNNANTRSLDVQTQLEVFLQNYDMSSQQVLTSTKDGGKTIMVKNRTNENDFLSFYEDEYGFISNIKRVEFVISSTENTVVVNFYKLDGTAYFSAGGNIYDKGFKVLSYNEDFFGNPETRARQHSVGCSASLMAASLPWSIGFGMINPLAGAVVSVVFWGMSELMCG
jgi:hypothetical protein